MGAAFFSVVIVALLAAIVYSEHSNAVQTVSVYVASADVRAGQAFDPTTVKPTDVHAAPEDFSYAKNEKPDGSFVFAHDVHVGDIIRSDDLISVNALVEVSVTIANNPPIVPGDKLDVYAAQGGGNVLIGHDLTVVSAGGTITLSVPAKNEGAWIAIAASSISLHAAKTVGGAPIPIGSLDPDAAINELNVSSPSAPPSSSPSP